MSEPLTIEQRLSHLEKLALHDDERWKTVAADLRALSFLIDAIVLAASAANSSVAADYLKSLSSFEADAKMLNAPTAMISRVRKAREFLEEKARKAKP